MRRGIQGFAKHDFAMLASAPLMGCIRPTKTHARARYSIL